MSEPRPPAPELSPAELRRLRRDAHALEPVVRVGAQGVTDAVLGAVDEALVRHELIKVRMSEPEDKQGMARELAEGAGAALCGLVGHTAILYRPRPERDGKARRSSRD